MPEKTKRTSFLLLIGVACMAPAAFAQCPQNIPDPTTYTACMNLTGVGYGNAFANVYVGPYTATINNGTPTAVICDDYKDESYIPEYWTADIISGSSGVNGVARDLTTTRDASLSGLTGTDLQKAYDEVGYLAIQLLNAVPGDSTTIGAIHFALWSVFDPSALDALGSAGNPSYDAAHADLLGAVDAVTGLKGDQGTNYSSFISQFTIYSPAGPPTQVCIGGTSSASCSPANGQPQEFLVKTPEPPFFALLGVDLSGVGALIFLLRRRRTIRS
jgi:hypothetical protein